MMMEQEAFVLTVTFTICMRVDSSISFWPQHVSRSIFICFCFFEQPYNFIFGSSSQCRFKYFRPHLRVGIRNWTKHESDKARIVNIQRHIMVSIKESEIIVCMRTPDIILNCISCDALKLYLGLIILRECEKFWGIQGHFKC